MNEEPPHVLRVLGVDASQHFLNHFLRHAGKKVGSIIRVHLVHDLAETSMG